MCATNLQIEDNLIVLLIGRLSQTFHMKEELIFVNKRIHTKIE